MRAKSSGVVLRLVQAQDNDLFVNRLNFAPFVTQVLDSNFGASKEPGEPNHADFTGGKSVWWSWIAPSNGLYQLDTTGSSFDTLLSVYSGASVSNLTLVADSDGDPADNYFNSKLTFSATAGIEYSFAIDGKNGASGSVVLNLVPAPLAALPNDRFANRIGFGGYQRSFTVDTSSGTKEQGEPNHASNPGGRSAWWSWRAPADGQCSVVAVGRTFDPILAVYRGTNLTELLPVAANNGDPATPLTARVTFQVKAGLSYEIALDSFAGNGAAVGGAGTLTLTLTPDLPPGANDNFANRAQISGTNVTVTGVNTNASKEAGEPNHAGNRGGKSIWWRWVAPVSSPVTIDTIGSMDIDGTNNLDTTLGVYTGSRVDSLTLIAGDDQGLPNAAIVTFNAVAGTEYQIAVDGYGDTSGTAQGAIVLNLHQYPTGPLIANDDFKDATPISAGEPGWTGATLGATREVGEPPHMGQADGHSAWWSFEATQNGPMRFTTSGSAFDTTLSIYTGTSLNDLTLVAERDDLAGGNFYAEVEFNVTAGTKYWIAVDGYRGAMGLTRLRVLPLAASNAPPNIYLQPESQARFEGASGGGQRVEFRVVATGSVPLAYQWQANGTNLPGQIAPVLVLTNAGLADAGIYQVVVSNAFGAVTSQPARFTQNTGPFNDTFSNRIPLVGSVITVSGSVRGASKEPGEPSHGANDGGRSVWWNWTAPVSGPVEIHTFGSSYDTTLAVYTGDALGLLALVAENDDLLAGKVNASRVVFHAVQGTEYRIAVDGYKTNSTSGNVVLNVRQPPEPPVLLADLPPAMTMMRGSDAVILRPAFGGIPPLLSAQWYMNGIPINGAKNLSLMVATSRTNSGAYQLIVTNNYGSVTSQMAAVRITPPQRIARIEHLVDGRVRIYFADDGNGELALATDRFEVQYTLNLTGSPLDWTTAHGVISNTGNELTFMDTASTGSSRRFYRVLERE
jgi:hypothetical protein